MTSYKDDIAACLGCPLRQAKCHGPCPCAVDGRDIIDHAKAGDCPKSRYMAQPEAVAEIVEVTATTPPVKVKGCGCSRRPKPSTPTLSA